MQIFSPEIARYIKNRKENFKTMRTKIIGEMLDNPNKLGIYPTTECFEKLDRLFDDGIEDMVIVLQNELRTNTDLMNDLSEKLMQDAARKADLGLGD